LFTRSPTLATFLGAALVLGLALSAETATAMGVAPIHLEMQSAGRAARAHISVSNDSAGPMPVEISVQRMTLDENGQRRETGRADESFLIVPPQAMIAPGSTQVFRLQWLGDPGLARSESFMLYVRQIPVRMPKGRSGVQVVKRMGVLVNVAPPRGEPALRIVDTGVIADRGGRLATVTVENKGPVHGLLPDGKLQLAAGNWSHTFAKGELATKLGIGLVEPGKRRRFVLPLRVPANVRRLEARLEYAPSRR
jgi:fimbrial chaperone protein